ncbi:MAG: hypothetical protein HRU20_17965 [Pseudomonadales bacterium]|nr:hypothetical protein [Pseudomonadales bacterium]
MKIVLGLIFTLLIFITGISSLAYYFSSGDSLSEIPKFGDLYMHVGTIDSCEEKRSGIGKRRHSKRILYVELSDLTIQEYVIPFKKCDYFIDNLNAKIELGTKQRTSQVWHMSVEDEIVYSYEKRIGRHKETYEFRPFMLKIGLSCLVILLTIFAYIFFRSRLNTVQS